LEFIPNNLIAHWPYPGFLIENASDCSMAISKHNPYKTKAIIIV